MELNVLTYNVQCRGLVDPNRRRARAVAERVKQGPFDVVCFQEVFAESARTELVKQFKDRLPQMVPSAGGHGIRTDSGLFVAANQTRVDHEFTAFGWGSVITMDVIAQKGVLGVLLDIDSLTGPWELLLVNTHFDAFSVNKHKQQLIAVSQMVENTVARAADPAQIAVLLCGDLNIVAGSAEYRDMLRAWRVRDVVAELPKPGSPTFTHPANNPTQRLDYILVFDAIRIANEDVPLRRIDVRDWSIDPIGAEDRLSDHLSLSATLEIA